MLLANELIGQKDQLRYGAAHLRHIYEKPHVRGCLLAICIRLIWPRRCHHH